MQSKILNSKNILLVLPENVKLNALSAVFAFAFALKEAKKNISILFKNKDNKFNFLFKPENISEEISEKGDIVITINNKKNNIYELRYEKDDNSALKIHLNTKNEGLSKDDILISLKKSPFELALIFDFEKSKAKEFIDKNREELKNTEIFLLNKDSYFKSLIEIIHNLNIPIYKESATNFFISALIENLIFKEEEILELTKKLIENEIDYEKVIKEFILQNIKNNKIPSIIFKNIKIKDKNKIISYLNLNEHKLSAKDIISGIITVQNLFPDLFTFLVLVKQDRQKYFAFLMRNLKDKKPLVFSIKADSFKDAENKVLKKV